jgi:AraC-like DNA-binding protein
LSPMSLDLTAQEVDEIWMEAEQQCPPVTSIDRLETICVVPTRLGRGYQREMELCPGLELEIFNVTYNDLMFRHKESPHSVQFMVHLSGVIDSGDHLYQDSTQSYVGGSGIQRAIASFHPATQPLVGIDIHMQPHLLSQFFATSTGELSSKLQPLVQGDDWQRVFSPKTTGAMRSVVQQIIDCPLIGITKRLYLQGKVIELIALQLDSILDHSRAVSSDSLKADTVARIHYAAEILRSRLETPPSQTELAQMVGVGQCTLIKGFREIFGMKPFAYLTRHRMEQAERLLRQPGHTVATVANQVGYANPAQFAAAFKRYFGMTPRECMRGVISR